MMPIKKPSRILRQIIASNYRTPDTDNWSFLAETDEFSWLKLADEAASLGLAPLLYFTVRKVNIDLSPPALELLRRMYLSTATENLLALENANRIVDSLAKAGVQNILLKGASLLQSVYPDPALRPMHDIDLLIQFSQLSRAVEAVAEAGYVQSQPFPYQDDTGFFWSQIGLSNEDSIAVILELHWHLLDNPYYSQRMSFEELWSRSEILEKEHREINILAADDLIIHLCAHNIFHHLGEYQRTAVDIGFILNFYRDAFDWERFLKNVIAYELASAASITLQRASDDWFVNVPQYVIEELGIYTLGSKERYFLFSQRSEVLKVFRSFLTVPGLLPKLRVAWGQLFPRREYMIWRYKVGATTPLPVAYLIRYLSGISGLISEIMGKKSKI